MKLSIRRALGAAAATVMAVATSLTVAASPAHAINTVNCDGRDDFLRVSSIHINGYHCFANAGEMNVAIYGVSGVYTGNNVVRIRFQVEPGGPWDEWGIGKWSGVTLPQWQQDGLFPSQPTHLVGWIKIH